MNIDWDILDVPDRLHPHPCQNYSMPFIPDILPEKKTLTPISTGALFKTTGTAALGDGFFHSIGAFVTTCYSSSLLSTDIGRELEVAVKSTVGAVCMRDGSRPLI